MDNISWIPIAIGTAIAGGAAFMFLFHPSFVMPVRRRLKWLSWFLIVVGSITCIVWLPSWWDWGYLSLRGTSVQAKTLGTHEEYLTDADNEHTGTITHVTYQFEAPVDGQPQQFQREGKLSRRFLRVSEHINVVYDPADPHHSRMTREFRSPRNALVASAVFLSLGGALLRLARRLGKSQKPRISTTAPASPARP